MKSTDPSPKTAHDDHWFVRVGEGSIYGPVPVHDLLQWAEAGRIAPGNQLSRDREQWSAAEDLPELHMNCYVRDPAGHVSGPFNPKALENLKRVGALPKDIAIFADEHAAGHPATSPPPEENTVSPEAAPCSPDNPMSPPTPPVPPDTTRAAAPQPTDSRDDASPPPPPGNPAPRGRRRTTSAPVKLPPTPAWETTDRPDLAETAVPNPSDADAQPSDSDTAGSPDVKVAKSARAASPDPGKFVIDTPATNNAPPALADAAILAALERERHEHAETLRFSNERDTTLRLEIETLRAQLHGLRESAPPVSEVKTSDTPPSSRADEATTERQPTPDRIVDLVRDWLAEDRALARQARDRTQARQEAIQDAIRGWWRTQTDGGNTVRRPATAMTPEEATTKASMDAMQRAHTREMESAREREQHLHHRIRQLEHQWETAQTAARSPREVLEESESLAEELRRSEQELVRLMRQQEEDRARAARNEAVLIQRIEELENAASPGEMPENDLLSTASPTPETTPSSAASIPEPLPSKPRGVGFRPTPWMRLK